MAEYGVEMKCSINRAETAWEREANACEALGDTGTSVLAAWKDGFNWLEADGTEVGWADWPPGGVQ